MLVKAVIIFASMTGQQLMVQHGWEVPKSLCGISKAGAFTPAGGSRTEGTLRVVCSK